MDLPITLNINGKAVPVGVDPAMPLLWHRYQGRAGSARCGAHGALASLCGLQRRIRDDGHDFYRPMHVAVLRAGVDARRGRSAACASSRRRCDLAALDGARPAVYDGAGGHGRQNHL